MRKHAPNSSLHSSWLFDIQIRTTRVPDKPPRAARRADPGPRFVRRKLKHAQKTGAPDLQRTTPQAARCALSGARRTQWEESSVVRPQTAQPTNGGLSRFFGDSVKISQPVSVTPTECSNCADSERSRVTAVQPSDRIFT